MHTVGTSTAAGSSKRLGGGKNGFEVVPQEKRKKGDDSDGSGTDSDDEFDALDDQVGGCAYLRKCVGFHVFVYTYDE